MYLRIMEFQSATRKNEIMTPAGKNEIRAKLELIILQRIRQTQKDKHFLLYVKCRPKFICAHTHTDTDIHKYTGPESIKGHIRDRKRLKGKE